MKKESPVSTGAGGGRFGDGGGGVVVEVVVVVEVDVDVVDVVDVVVVMSTGLGIRWKGYEMGVGLLTFFLIPPQLRELPEDLLAFHPLPRTVSLFCKLPRCKLKLKR